MQEVKAELYAIARHISWSPDTQVQLLACCGDLSPYVIVVCTSINLIWGSRLKGRSLGVGEER